MQDRGSFQLLISRKRNQEEFRGMVADYYYRLTTETVKRHDAEHLILGTRLHDWSKI